MRVAVFSSKLYDIQFLTAADLTHRHELEFLEPRLTRATVALAAQADAVCIFVNDEAGADVVEALAHAGVRLIALRCAGFNHVDLIAAQRHGISVVRVPKY